MFLLFFGLEHLNPLNQLKIIARLRQIEAFLTDCIITNLLTYGGQFLVTFWSDKLLIRVGAISKLYVSTPKSFTFVLKSTMNIKKWYLKVNNHPLIGFLDLQGILLHNLFRNQNFP